MDILIVGEGTFSKNLAKVFRDRGHNIFVTSRKTDRKLQLDLSHTPDISNLPKSDWAVIAAAVTGYKACEENAEAYKVNVTNTVQLANSLMKKGTKIVFPSSTAVFNGDVQFAKCSELTSPETSYGSQKVEVENYLLNSKNNALVIRYSKLLEYKSGLIFDWITSLVNGKSITAFTDLSIAPVMVNDAAFVTCRLMEERKTNVYHCSPPEEVSYYDFAKALCMEFGFDTTLIVKGCSKDFNISYTPKFSSLEASGTETTIDWHFPRIKELIKKLKNSYDAAT
ncbi:sugar nucleotide-binding protein [Maridesulfovibrio frigidus]|uniref:sugar nucleotide-binding protein n=1 Tax=Maridesulfovibrio frigidus TaxID=340956 RepID=UPI0004E1E05E|nr:sugar nucleotide-binding protein [Maridesulfovibrio frigidus]